MRRKAINDSVLVVFPPVAGLTLLITFFIPGFRTAAVWTGVVLSVLVFGFLLHRLVIRKSRTDDFRDGAEPENGLGQERSGI